jgi:UDP-glucuronate decarboxylase
MRDRAGVTALVTGGAGFIGSHLCEALLARGHSVICLDNFQTGRPVNIAHLVDHARFRVVEADITRPLPTGLAPRLIFNLACAASPAQYQRDPVHTWKTSVLGAMHLLERAESCGATVLQASTSEIYGDPDVHPQTESYWGNVNPVGPRACYDEGKRAAETLFFDLHRTRGVRIKVARIFNTYGPRMHEEDGRIISNFVTQALRGEPLTIYGDGRQTRSFCYVDDMVRALLALMATPDEVVGPVNVGNPDELTVLEVAQRVLELAASAATIEFCPLPVDDPRRRRPDIERAQRLLSWQPKVDLDTGLRRTIADFAARIGDGASVAQRLSPTAAWVAKSSLPRAVEHTG